MRLPIVGLAVFASLSLSGCAYGGYGGYSGYGGYGGGYSGLSIGYSSPYYGSGYGNPYYGAGYGYGSPYGWYDNFYYPGSGYYVYDTYRRPRVWTNSQQRYWTARRAQTVRTTTTTVNPNWSGFNRRSTSYTTRQAVRQVQRTTRQTARQDRQTARQERQQTREELRRRQRQR
jgi:hypothetical protein